MDGATPQRDERSGATSTPSERGRGDVATADASNDPGAKTVAESRVEMTQLMRPQQANFADNVHGGVIMGLMDEAAYLCASRYAETYCVTVAVDQVEFQSPVRVGEEVTVQAAVHRVGDSSMQVGISVYAEDPQEPGSRRLTNRSFFTMVARDDDGGTARVPRLVCETADDRRRRCEAELRMELKEEFKEELERGMCQFDPA